MKPDSFEDNRKVAKRGGGIAGNARRELEAEIGQSVVTSKNANQLNEVVLGMLESIVEQNGEE